MILVHSPDIDQPVGGDEAGTGQHGPAQFAIRQRGCQTDKVFPEIEDDEQQRHRPDNPMGDYFQRADVLQQLEIDRH